MDVDVNLLIAEYPDRLHWNLSPDGVSMYVTGREARRFTLLPIVNR